jgi:hypothetical protein
MRARTILLWFILECVFAAIIGFAANSPIPPTIALAVCVFLIIVETVEGRRK